MDDLDTLESDHHIWSNTIQHSFSVENHLQNENCVYEWHSYTISYSNEIFISMIYGTYNWE